jgi:membrane-bound serine protease (ClpP class)
MRGTRIVHPEKVFTAPKRVPPVVNEGYNHSIMWNRCIALTALVCLLMCVADVNAAPATQRSPVAIVALHGEVNDYTRDLLIRQINQARKLGAKTVILDLDTYGGLVVAGLDITHFLRGQSDLHIIAYVNRAISAGSMIAVSCNEIVMAPSAVIGDCAPIIFKTDGNIDPLPAAERAKEQSPIVNDFDASADRNGYDRQLLESMVVVERVVYWVENPKTHEKKFVDQAGYDALTKSGWIPVKGVPCPVDGADSLLTVQTDEAVKLGLASGVSASAEVLALQRGQLIADLTPGPGEKVVEFLNNDVIRSLLFTILTISLWVVLGSPGHGLAESCAIVSLALLLGIPLLTGYAAWWEIIMIFGGLALLAFEVFVFPGHGVSAIAGVILILAGLLLTFVGPEPGGGVVPNSDQSWANLRHGALAITGGLTASLLLSFWLRSFLPKLPYFNRLILTTTSGGDQLALNNTAAVPPENSWPGVGTSGVAVTDLRPGGSAEFLDLSLGDTRPVAVVSESGYVTAGAKLIVRESRGNRIVVKPVAT